jgi:hypothetical protein
LYAATGRRFDLARVIYPILPRIRNTYLISGADFYGDLLAQLQNSAKMPLNQAHCDGRIFFISLLDDVIGR